MISAKQLRMDTSTAPGHPGAEPHWSSSAKDGVGTATASDSRVWFTVSHGILNEIYHPYIDHATTRDFGMLVADGHGFFSEEKRETRSEIHLLAPGVPGYRLTNTCTQGRYRLTKTIVTDPQRDVLLQHLRFEALQGALSDYTLYALLNPHIGNRGWGNRGWLGDYRDRPILFAKRDSVTLALACSTGWAARSCGYAGVSDGWRDVHEHGRMTWQYSHADDGNIALAGAIDLSACGGELVLALGFGRTASEAGQQAHASLLTGFDEVARQYVTGWQEFQARFHHRDSKQDGLDLYRVGLAVLETHEGKRFRGGRIASLSLPWGQAATDTDLGGYHLVWPRDQVEAAGAMLASGDVVSARETLFYLMCTQEADGRWPQNMWLDGTPYWTGVPADETALVVLLADALRRQKALDRLNPWPMVRSALKFLARTGPLSQQDRWEENPGYSTFTLATQITAFLAGADLAEAAGERDVAEYLRETADSWNAQIEDWTYVRGTDLARRVGVDGYYVRLTPPEVLEHGSAADCTISIKNQSGPGTFPASDIVSPDALALVRFGLRAADDPRIINTVKVIDATLKTETATGPVWHRYTHDGYGETADGSPFQGAGIGRGWPLLAGERAHYELAAGNRKEAERLFEVMGAQTSRGGLLPEQIWDAADIPERELFNGRPAGSAMPLVWAHAEYLKLARSLADGAVYDTPPQPVQRYLNDKTGSSRVVWRFDHRCRKIAAGKTLRIETLAPARVRWSKDDWRTIADTETRDTGLGVHFVDLPTMDLSAGATIHFTCYWPQADRWENRDFAVVTANP